MLFPGRLYEPVTIHKLTDFINKIFFKIDTSIINFLLPSFLKNVLRKKNSFLQQLINIDNTKYSKKIIL